MNQSPPSEPDRRPRRSLGTGKSLLFAALATLAVLGIANTVVEWAESQALVDTHRPDDGVQFKDEPVYEQKGEWFRTSTYGNGSLIESRFAANKGDRWRMFVLGGSFAMGTPYVAGETPRHGDEGGIPSWIQARLAEAFPNAGIEVVNAAAGGQNSRRVREIALEVLQLQPDVLLVATGNNEGSLDPSLVRSQLQELGGYRLLRKLLTPPADSGDARRSWFTPQDPASDALRDQFRTHIRAILQAADAAKVPVLLATMPINLSYLGFEPGKTGTDSGWPPLGDPCQEGIERFDAGDYLAALDPLQACVAGPRSQQPPPVRSYQALAKLESGRTSPGSSQALAEDLSPCIQQGIELYYTARYEAAIGKLKSCDLVADALLWIGRSRRQLGQADLARAALYQSVELLPRNRSRPSYNEILRQEARAFSSTYLVDLAAAAEQASPDGIPGHELFLDYCHMHWAGYARMARAVLDALSQAGLGPASPKFPGKAADLNELVRAFRLPPLPARATPPPATGSSGNE